MFIIQCCSALVLERQNFWKKNKSREEAFIPDNSSPLYLEQFPRFVSIHKNNTLKPLICDYFVCLIPCTVDKYNFFQCIFALGQFIFTHDSTVAWLQFCTLGRWFCWESLSVRLTFCLQRERNVAYWNWIRSRKNKCNLKMGRKNLHEI